METVQDVGLLLAKKRSLDQRAAAQPGFVPHLQELRAWQAARLAGTYDDLRRDPRYARVIEFFLSDLYGPHDFSARDRELTRAWHIMKRTLPGAARSALERSVELEVLSEELDHAMVAATTSWPLDAARYAVAYRRVAQREAREHQIALVLGVAADLDAIVRRAWVAAGLRLMRGPAHAAGFRLLQDFLERGFAAFGGMKDARPFLRAVREREIELLNQLFAGGGERLLDHADRGRRDG
jgi:hypothetical protein